MKTKPIALILMLVSLIVIASCSPSQGWDITKLEKSTLTISENAAVTMSLANDDIAGDAKELAVIIKNSNGECSYGYEPRLEIEYQSEWYVVPIKEMSAWIEIAVILQPGSETEESFILFDHYGTLPAGSYRYVKAFHAENETIHSAVYFKIA